MARRVEILLDDDIDGSRAEETVSFALDGVAYEIDLSHENAQSMRDVLEKYVRAAHKTGKQSSNTRKPKKTNETPGSADANAIRAWAQEQGLSVNARGRVPADIVQRYNDAHK